MFYRTRLAELDGDDGDVAERLRIGHLRRGGDGGHQRRPARLRCAERGVGLAVGVARVVFGGALVAVPVLAGPAGHDLLRVVLLDLGQESRGAAAAHRRHGSAPVGNGD